MTKHPLDPDEGQREMKNGRTIMWISGPAFALGIILLLIQLSNSGEVSGRAVSYTILTALGLVRGFVLYREGLGRSRGKEPRVLIAAGNERRVIIWVLGICAAIILFVVGVRNFL